MIIQPDFLEHWKTRALVELTGDEAAPLAVIRLWAHCQSSRRGFFPDMTPAQLASICRWRCKRISCHTALIRAGFVEKLSPKGFMAHEWAEHNRQLLQKWEAGKSGGRPKICADTQEQTDSEKPTDNRPITVRELEQNRTEQIDQRDKNRTDEPELTGPEPKDGNGGSGSSSPFSAIEVCSGSGSVLEAVSDIASGMTAGSYPDGGRPTVEQVRAFMDGLFRGAGEFAEKWHATMTRQQWKDQRGKPVHKWRDLASRWASACERKKRG
jgi:hypothetical protein